MTDTKTPSAQPASPEQPAAPTANSGLAGGLGPNAATQQAKPAPSPVLPPVPTTVKPARRRTRHVFLMLSFIVVVLGPVALSGFYLWAMAADQYASRIAFSVRSEEQSSAVELLGGITDLSGSSSSDTDILFAYLNSQELVAKVDDRVDLEGIWSAVSTDDDPVFAYDPSGTIEDLFKHWERKVSIIYDSSSKLIEIRFLAFEPLAAQRIAAGVLAESTEMINNLSVLAREDAIRYAREDLAVASARLREARQSLTLFRNRTQIVDPSIDTQNQMGVLVTLQQQLADALIEGDLLRDTTSEGDPRITQANRRVEVIQNRIDAERQNLGLGSGSEAGVVFADLVGEYEGLIVDREFAEATYTTALVAFDSAQAEARRQSRYLAAHVQPSLAQKAEYPERLKLVMLVALFSFLIWCVMTLVFYSLRDRS